MFYALNLCDHTKIQIELDLNCTDDYGGAADED